MSIDTNNSHEIDIGKSARRGVAWTGIAQLIKQVSDFGVGILMARLLSPTDFGIIGASMIILSFVSILTSFGFSSAIIQRSTLDNEFIKTAQTLSFALGCLSTLAMCISAHWISLFYKNQFFETAIPVMSLIYLISSFGVVPSALLTRNLHFNKITSVSIVGSAIYGVTALSMALAGLGVWSLIIGPIVSLLGSTILISYVSNYFPRFSLCTKYTKELINFGGFVTVSSLLNHVARNADNLIIGRYLGAEMLGLYARAYNLATLVKELVVSIFGSVLFPSFARLQQDVGRVRDVYFKSINIITIISLPVCLLLLVIAPEFINSVYGHKWSGATLSLQLLCFSGFIYSLYVPCTSLLLGLGKTRLYAKLQVIYSVTIVSSVFLVYEKGIEYIALSVSISILVCFVSYVYSIKMIILTTYMMYWDSTKVAISGTLVMLISVVLVKYLLSLITNLNEILLLLIEVLIAVMSYGLYVIMNDYGVVRELKMMIYNKVKQVK
jgi:PST family polysaccharide transporter